MYIYKENATKITLELRKGRKCSHVTLHRVVVVLTLVLI